MFVCLFQNTFVTGQPFKFVYTEFQLMHPSLRAQSSDVEFRNGRGEGVVEIVVALLAHLSALQHQLLRRQALPRGVCNSGRKSYNLVSEGVYLRKLSVTSYCCGNLNCRK